MKQEDLIKRIPHHELLKALYYSQALFFIIAIGLSFFFFDHINEWINLFNFNGKQLVYYGLVPGIIIVVVNICLKFLIPERFLDDGGINEKVFKNSSVKQIFFISLVVAFSEELLFRGLIQTVFGYVFASLFFVIVHVRYLKKPVLLISIIVVSFYLGYLYLVTGNLLVTIFAHFIVDFILGLIIRYERK